MSNTLTLGRNSAVLDEEDFAALPIHAGSLSEYGLLGFAAGDANLYRYVGNDPVNETDPTGLASVGHHWVPVSVIEQFQGYLTPNALDYAIGSVSGPTNPTHNYGTYGGVTHAQYNDRVRDLLDKFIDMNGGNVDENVMRRFVSNVENGLDNAGKADSVLGNFNNGIRCERNAYLAGGKGRGFTGLQTPDVIKKRGQWYKTVRGNWFSTVVGASLATWASDALAQPVETMNMAGDSMYFRNGVKALAEGDLQGAERNFFGEGGMDGASLGGFQGEVLAKLGNNHAAQFAAAYRLAKQRAEAIANHEVQRSK